MDRRWLVGGIKEVKRKDRMSFLFRSLRPFRCFIKLIEACGNAKEETDEGEIGRSAKLFIKPIT